MRLSGILVSLGISAVAMTANAKPFSTAVPGSKHATPLVQGGDADTTDTFAVGVCLPFQGNSGPGNCGGVCSGVLVAPNLVLTARHCVDATPTTIDCSTATFGGLTDSASNFYVTTNASMTSPGPLGWYQVRSIVTPTATALCGNDLAILQLLTNVPATEATPVTPAVQYPVYNPKHYGMTETAIGYGESAPSMQSTAQTRRDKQNIAIECVFDDPFTSDDCVTQDASWAMNARNGELVAGNGTCEGDSGSGAFDQASYTAGSPIALGVLSRGSESDDGTTCELAIYTRMDTFRDLIVQAVTSAASAGGYAVPSWTTPEVDDGVYPASDAGAATNGSDSGAVSAEGDAAVLPTNLAVGAMCSADSECASGSCHASGASGSFICTTACSAGGASGCASGMSCSADGFCEASATASGDASGGSSDSGGCSLPPASAGGPGRPVPWKQATLASAALGFLFMSRKRHPRRTRR